MARTPRRPAAPRRDAGRPRGAPVTEAVLSRTLEELAAVGLEGMRVERIAARAEVNKTSVYRRWPTREALVAAALEGVLASFSTAMPDTGSLRGDVLALVTPIAEFLASDTGRAVLRAAMASSSALAVADVAARAVEGGGRGPLASLVRRARRRGEWRRGVAPTLLFGSLVGAVIHRVMLEHGAVTPRWLASLVTLHLDGVHPR